MLRLEAHTFTSKFMTCYRRSSGFIHARHTLSHDAHSRPLSFIFDTPLYPVSLGQKTDTMLIIHLSRLNSMLENAVWLGNKGHIHFGGHSCEFERPSSFRLRKSCLLIASPLPASKRGSHPGKASLCSLRVAFPQPTQHSSRLP